MFNVMIVDDEAEIRTGLKLKIDWNALGFKVCGEASHGKEALALLENEKYHVIITDIRMPVMNGLDMLRHCAEKYPDIKFIVLSGYDDFSYVKLALQCGAKDYLLKPVIRVELTEILIKIRKEIEDELQEQSENVTNRWQLTKMFPVLQEQFMVQIIKGEQLEPSMIIARAKQLQLGNFVSEDQLVQYLSVEMRIPPGRFGQDESHSVLFKEAFQMMCRELAQNYAKRVFSFHDWNHPHMMHFVINVDPSNGGQLFLNEYIEQLQMNVKQYLKVETVIGVGRPVLGVNKLKEGYASSLLAWSQSLIGPESQVILVASPDSSIDLTPEIEKRIALAIESTNLEDFTHLLHTIFGAEEEFSIGSYSLLVFRVVLLLDSIAKKYGIEITETQELLWASLERIWKFDSKEKVIEQLGALAASIVKGVANFRDPQLSMMETIRRFIDENYAYELSLSMLAERFYMNATYLSELFKKYVGSNFSNYLTEVRMTKAEKLLQDPRLRLIDIAELVGYSNASYFSNVFKKHYGMSPNDYRSTLMS